MSGKPETSQNIERHRGVLGAFNARDIEAFIVYCDPGIEFHSAFAAVGGAVYHGHAGVRTWHRDLEETWEDIHIEPEAYFDLGERPLMFYVLLGRGKHSGVEVAMPNAQVVSWRDGRIVYYKVYVHRDDALSDLGMPEDALKAIDP